LHISDKKIVVTGGLGFMGSHFVDLVLEGSMNNEVKVLDANTYCGSRKNLRMHVSHGRLDIIEGSIRHRNAVNEAIRNADIMVHFAAETHVDRSIASRKTFFDTNVMGTLFLLEACLWEQVEKIIVVSTDEVYGNCAENATEDNTVLAPMSPYAASKAAADLTARAFYTTYDLPVCVVRPVNNFGPRQYPEKLCPLCITSMLDGRKVPIYGDGRNTREWLYVRDTCRGIISLLEHEDWGGNVAGEIFNLGSGVERSVLEVTDTIGGILGIEPEKHREWVEDRPGHVKRHRVDWRKINRLTGWEPETTFEKGMKQTVNWYRKRHRGELETWWED